MSRAKSKPSGWSFPAARDVALQIIEATPAGVMLTDEKGDIVAVNSAFCRITGHAAEEVVGRNPRVLQSGRHDEQFYRDFWETLNRTGQWEGEIWNRRKNGETFPEWLNVVALRDDEGAVTHYVAVFSDITSLKLTDQRLLYLAHHDPLTGLPNRLLLIDRLDRALVRARRSAEKVAVLYIDLDGFKEVNDSHGHLYGDLLLQGVVGRLGPCLRASDTLARFGGDEFISVLEGVRSAEEATAKAEELVEVLRQPFLLEGIENQVGASVGVALYPTDAETAESLTKCADEAMYLAKNLGRGQVRSFVEVRQRRGGAH